jgi:galactokinase/galacturonokinase
MTHPTVRIRSAEPPIIKPVAENEQVAQLVERLRTLGADQAEIRVVRAPLRICPLGAHIDHQLGVVTGMTIDRAVLMAYAPVQDSRVYVESLNFPQAAEFRLEAIPAYRKGDWANYVRGAVSALQQEARLDRGLIGVVGGAMPIGGLSSSAAVTIAYLLALETINDLRVDAYENVAFCQYSENRYIGLNNGILDQSVILHSAHDHLTRIDCESVEVERIPAGLSAAELERRFGILVVYSGVTHALVGTDYNNRVLECQTAARELLEMAQMPVPVDVRLRHVPDEVHAAHAERLEGPLRKRARHYFGEMARVAAGTQAWRTGDLETLGRLVSESGESSVKWYECGSPQLVTLYEVLRATPGVYGTRFSGAGFRGNCIALIDPAAGPAIAEAVHAQYPAAHPDMADAYSIHFCRADGPATAIHSPRDRTVEA